MAFNPAAYKAPAPKKLPVILLLDTSGTMYGDKIENLHSATLEMIKAFAESEFRELVIDVAIITFGREVALHTPYTAAKVLAEKGIEKFEAYGMTPLGGALRLAQKIIEDREITPSRIYRPAVILVSDGAPNDQWVEPMQDFIENGRTAKCQRFAVAIGDDADKNVLKMFTQDEDNLFNASAAKDISEQFKTITMSVSMRVASGNPNNIKLK